MRKSRYTTMAILKQTKAGARVLLIFPRINGGIT